MDMDKKKAELHEKNKDWAEVTAHRSLIYMGDLARYQIDLTGEDENACATLQHMYINMFVRLRTMNILFSVKICTAGIHKSVSVGEPKDFSRWLTLAEMIKKGGRRSVKVE